MKRQMIWLILVLVAGELGVFYWQNRDLVFVNRPVDGLLRDARFPDAARAVVAREQVSRRVLERVADVSRQRREWDLHVDALERIVSAAPDDAVARLRLAQALRNGGRLDEAEQIYRHELDRTVKGEGQ